jgi:hypothetical protein
MLSRIQEFTVAQGVEVLRCPFVKNTEIFIANKQVKYTPPRYVPIV